MRMRKENKRRAKIMDQVLEYYGTLGGDADSPQDILADLRHWCDWKKQSYSELDRMAHNHYTEEAAGRE